jgi:alpha-D-xyloside xylohydrolase
LRVYPGRDADFLIYEDENDTYNYEKGVAATIPLHWDEGSETLTIGNRRGQFPGMLGNRTFRVVFVRENHGVGTHATDEPDKTVTYSGNAITVTP